MRCWMKTKLKTDTNDYNCTFCFGDFVSYQSIKIKHNVLLRTFEYAELNKLFYIVPGGIISFINGGERYQRYIQIHKLKIN